VLYEVQQPVDLTYRIHDWGRVGLDGRPRPLHLEKARAVLNAASRPRIRRDPHGASVRQGPLSRTTLVASRPFTLERWTAGGQARVPVSDLLAITCIGGEGTLEGGGERVPVARGRSCVVAAAAGEMVIQGRELDLLVAAQS
jgi:mannose-6-phosphate isomerase